MLSLVSYLVMIDFLLEKDYFALINYIRIEVFFASGEFPLVQLRESKISMDAGAEAHKSSS